jgi:hypothetical protein
VSPQLPAPVAPRVTAVLNRTVTTVSTVGGGAVAPALKTVTGVVAPVADVGQRTVGTVTSVIAATVTPAAKLAAGIVSSPALPTVGALVGGQSPPQGPAAGASHPAPTSAGRPATSPASNAPLASANPTGGPAKAGPGAGSPVASGPSQPVAPGNPVGRAPGISGTPASTQPVGGLGMLEVAPRLAAFAASSLSIRPILSAHAHGSAIRVPASVAGASVIPPATGAYGSGGGASSGGLGFFFGIAALLALASLAVAGLIWRLRPTVSWVAPPPFLALQERPG